MRDEFLTWCLQQSPVPPHRLATHRPDFLVISPPKTGSTWLADNLRCHPQLFVPPDKELKYFSSWLRHLDLNWYLSQFDAAADRVKGEASPSYAILPVERIRLIRRLMPDVKLIYLMREPVSRAWSHARHNFRYREANFTSCTSAIGDVTDEQWQENFSHEWPLAGGDYLGQLRRWLSVFPHEQVYVGFYETIATDPQGLLRELFTFLGVETDVDWSRFPLAERILPGLSAPLPDHLRDFLRRLWYERTRELASFLDGHFHLRLPAEWAALTEPAPDWCSEPPEVFRRDLDDRYLARLVAQEEVFPSESLKAVAGHHGYSLAYYRARWYAIDQALGTVHLPEMSAREVESYFNEGRLLTAPSVGEARARIDAHLATRLHSGLQAIETLRAELQAARERIVRLEQDLQACVNEPYQAGADGRQALANTVLRVVAEDIPLYRWHVGAAKMVRKLWRCVRQPVTEFARTFGL
jgi:hypothetical protein